MLGGRFMSVLDECIHVLLAVYIADIYEIQKVELIDNYGIDIIEQACEIVLRDYEQVIQRLR